MVLFFLLSFSNFSLLVYRDITDFWVLILYLATCLNSFINSNRVFLGACVWSVNKYNFISSCSDLDAFNFLSCLIYLARNSSTVLNRSDENRHPSFVPDLREKDFPTEYNSCGFSVCDLYYVEVINFYSWFVEFFLFNHKMALNFVKCFFCIN